MLAHPPRRVLPGRLGPVAGRRFRGRLVRPGLVGGLLPGILPDLLRGVPVGLLGLLAGLPGLLLGLLGRLLGLVLGPVPRLPHLFLGLVAGPPGLLLCLVPGLPGLRPGFVAGLLGLLAGVGGRGLAHPAGLAGGPGQLLAQAAHGLPDVLPDLADDVADRRGQLLLELVQLVAAAAQFLAPGLGDPVDLPSVYLVVGDQALFLQPGQPGVDRAR